MKIVQCPNTKTAIKLTVNIKPGPASTARRAVWRKFWAKIAQIKDVK